MGTESHPVGPKADPVFLALLRASARPCTGDAGKRENQRPDSQKLPPKTFPIGLLPVARFADDREVI